MFMKFYFKSIIAFNSTKSIYIFKLKSFPMELWNKNHEKQFFINSLKSASLNQLFYQSEKGRFYSYWPKDYKGRKSTLQSRNSLIGAFTENYVSELFEFLTDDLYVIRQAQIPSIGINSSSPADVVISTKNKRILSAEDVKAIFEVKMSLVWNWEYDLSSNRLIEIGDYRSHQGKPSFTRSDSILKAIGKCIDIRVYNNEASQIPLIVLGNAPLSNGFCKKADFLKNAGLIQGFWSLNPFPLNHGNTRKTTPHGGFIRFDNLEELSVNLNNLFNQDLNFFSSMQSPEELGKIIETSNDKETYEQKAYAFLKYIQR